MPAPPTVTVLLAVYNSERFIEEAVRSILAQTFKSFELVVVDDGSTDDTPEIVRRLADHRVRIIRDEANLGLTASLNRGLAEARGEFVARLDADDISEPTRLARQVLYLRDNPTVALVGSGWRTIDEKGRVLWTEIQPSSHAVLRWAMAFFCPFCHSAVMWRRALVTDRVGEYDPSFQSGMDYDLWVRIAAVLPVANLTSRLVRYRVGPHTMTSTHPARSTGLRRARSSAAHSLFPEGSSDRRLWNSEADRILQIIDGWRPDSGAEEVAWVTGAIQRLADSYCAREVVSREGADAVEAWTRRWLSRQLLKASIEAHRSGATARRDASFRGAIAMRPAALASILAARYARARLGLGGQ